MILTLTLIYQSSDRCHLNEIGNSQRLAEVRKFLAYVMKLDGLDEKPDDIDLLGYLLQTDKV